MIQCFSKRDFLSTFPDTKKPQLFSVSRTDADYSQHSRFLHKHNDRFELLFVRSGSSAYVVEDTCYDIKEGDLVICNNGVLHDEVSERHNNFSSYGLAITNLKLNDLPENHLVPNSVSPVISSGKYTSYFLQMYGTMYDLLASDIPGTEETCNNLMMSILSLTLHVIEESSHNQVLEDTKESVLGLRIKKYVDEHYDEDLSLQSVSNYFRINSYYLSHVFKKEIGYSPMQYVSRRRIGEAQSLLINTNKSITDISSLVGFSNPNHFNVQFNKYVGLSPRTFRKTYTLIEKE